ncbi:Glutathione peroxidase [Hondaea fermentalgiana]|uniref:Glutathione peroxidase n=1 Tax=Hondaea fermentalgiana TaxID=2315210 RepID=A0A2R5GXL5_9STRA|nr:Glutathione peroxidase [Hondaea fermentalgiana]|eukprot:GBG33443.1 Glutathione peroxidase [Hondaea fermentalgiana]
MQRFGGQEPGDAADIREFVSTKFDPPIAFTLTEKINVNGDDAHPLWKYLKSVSAANPEEPDIKWNFTKFLVSRDGATIERAEPRTPVLTLEDRIKEMLAQPAPSL